MKSLIIGAILMDDILGNVECNMIGKMLIKIIAARSGEPEKSCRR